MTITDIQRVRLRGALEAPPNTLADEAAAVLGYSAGSKVIVDAKPLETVLAQLGIEVLDWKQVLRYQYTKQAEENSKRLASMDNVEWNWRSDLNWDKEPIDKYTAPIPDFVLNKAIQIKKALPECEILVEALRQSADPFLVVRLKEGYSYEGYYVEVWDETSFERGV